MTRHKLALFAILVASTLLVSAACSPLPAAIHLPSSVFRQATSLGGRIVYVRSGNLWVWQGGESRQLTEGGSWRQPAFSPNGAEIAYVFQEQNFADLFAMAADGSSTRRLTRGQSARVLDNDWSVRPSWSRDGSQIAFVSDANSFFPLVWVMKKDGTGQRQVMANGALEIADSLSWGPEDKRIAVTAMVREPSQIYLLDVSRGATEKFTNHPRGAFDPAWSPDGESIAYIGREGPRGEVWIRRVEGTDEARNEKLSFVRSPAWSPDGRNLAVLSAQTGAFEIWVAPIRSEGETISIGEFRQLTRDGGIDAVSGLSWSK